MPGDRIDKFVRFGPFELDLATADLYRTGRKVRLPEQQFQILEMLLRAKGDLVSREEIRKRLWPNDTVVEFDRSINSSIKKLRAALGDSAEEPRFIETFARRGYRIMVEVHFPEAAPAVDVTKRTLVGHLAGQRVSHYRLLEVLGGGGMGVVYRAEDIKLGRAVALKFLPPELTDDPAAQERFEREARAASSLNHPNICTIYEIEEYDGQPFIAMELLEGCTLREMLLRADAGAAEGPSRQLPVERLMDIAMQISTGLAAAHSKGIIHRDIKPANIFVTTHGQVKILDFGLAKLHQPDSESDPEISLTKPDAREWNPLLTLTRTGVTIGTAAYMSPEQVRGEKLDPRTDLFSFGLVMYEMATGQRAFSGDTAPVLRDAILNYVPALPRELNPRIPGKIESVINKLMVKDREFRYQTSREVLADLGELSRATKPRRARWWASVAAVGVLAIAGATWLAIRKDYSPRLPEIRLQQLTLNSSENPVVGGAISPDGRYLEFSDTQGLHLKLLGGGEILTIPQPEHLKNQSVTWDTGAWFPDSTGFVLNSHPSKQESNEWNSNNSSVWKVSVLGSAPVKLRDQAVAWAVSPDGSTISFGTNRGKLGEREAWLMGSSGEQARRLFQADDLHVIDALRWSPDGTRYLYVLLDESGATLVSRDLKGGNPVTLYPPSEMKRINDILWLHDGSVVYNRTETESVSAVPVCNYWKMRLNLGTGRRSDGPKQLTNWPDVCVNGGSLTTDDKKLAFARSSEVYTTYIADLDDRTFRIMDYRHFTLEDTNEFAVAWTGDSKSLVIVQPRANDFRIFKQGVQDGSRSLVAPSVDASWLQYQAVSPDGKWFITRVWPKDHPPVSVPQAAFSLPVMRFPLEGGPSGTILYTSRPVNLSCAHEPSGLCVLIELADDYRHMVVTGFDPIVGRGPEVARFELDPNREIYAEKLLCKISPDGTRLALTRSPDLPIEVYSIRDHITHTIPASAAEKTLYFNWAADSKGLFVTRSIPSGYELVHIDFQGHVTPMRACIGRGCMGPAAPDGRHLAIDETKLTKNLWMMENF